MTEYSVTVGNIGTTYTGESLEEARATFDEYVNQSKAEYGRASSEEVTCWQDGEPIFESAPGQERYGYPETNRQNLQRLDQL